MGVRAARSRCSIGACSTAMASLKPWPVRVAGYAFSPCTWRAWSTGARGWASPRQGAPLAREVAAFAAHGGDATLKLILTRGAALARGYALSGQEEPTRILLRYAPRRARSARPLRACAYGSRSCGWVRIRHSPESST